MLDESTPTIDMQVIELERAGWKRWRGRPDIWVAPWKALYLGPHGAWKVMKASPENEE
jgi:hypothetical protein